MARLPSAVYAREGASEQQHQQVQAQERVAVQAHDRVFHVQPAPEQVATFSISANTGSSRNRVVGTAPSAASLNAQGSCFRRVGLSLRA
ncbi:MAG: hypothetical protein IPO74_11010 [Thermomonas sp.]|nr:hypothetical protein [Thermomonas sp.]